MQLALVKRDVPAQAAEKVNASSRLTAEQHLGIYRRGYIARLRECMKNQFSALAFALGDDLFRMFADEYLGAFPSTSYTLGELGRKFPGFLESTRPRDTGETWPDFMIELARFEFDLSVIYDQHTEEATVLVDENASDDELKLVPIFRLYRHRFPVARYYLDSTRKKRPELPFEQDSFCAVTRNDYKLGITDLKPGQYQLLKLMAEGASVAEAKARLVSDYKFDPAKLEEFWPGWKRSFIRSGFFAK